MTVTIDGGDSNASSKYHSGNYATQSVADLISDGSYIILTRIGNVVSVHWTTLSSTTQTNGTVLLNIPDGYKPVASMDATEFASVATGTSGDSTRWVISGDTLTSYNWTKGSTPTFFATWLTVDAFPDADIVTS